MRRPVHLGVSDDLDLLLELLAPGRGGRFLTVSAHGAGEAALALAAHGADEVVAVDLEAPRALREILELKREAFALLGREDALVVYGLRPASALRRSALARQLARALPHNALTPYVAEGLVHADAIAAFFRGFMWATDRLAPHEHHAIFYAGDTEAFRRATARVWLPPALALIGRRGDLFFPDAEWRASEHPKALARDPLAYFERLIAKVPANNPLFAPIVRGRDAVLPERMLPPHLRVAAYDATRARADRVIVRDAPEGSFDGAYLSNVVDYLTPQERQARFAELRRALAPGAPVLVYSNEAYPKVPLELGFELDAERSREAQLADRAGIYGRVEVYRSAPPARHLKVVEAPSTPKAVP